MQLIQDYEEFEEVNKQLEKMGYNIGTRLIEDFLAKSSLGRCSDFREVGEVIAKVWILVYLAMYTVQAHLHLISGRLQVIPEHRSSSYACCANSSSFPRSQRRLEYRLVRAHAR